MFFRDIAGQEAIKERLIRSVKDERISHAQLFYGPEGHGALPLAMAYVQYIACQNRMEKDSCGTCPACTKMSKVIHPDLHFIFPLSAPLEKEKDESRITLKWRELLRSRPHINTDQWYQAIDMDNKQGQIGKVQADEVLRNLFLKSYESEFKFVIIWMAERMNLTAANRLLKMIEEPPEKTLILMVAQSIETILPTILSRSQQIYIPAVTDDAVVTYLKNNGQTDSTKAFNYAAIAAGDINKALSLNEKQDEPENVLEEMRKFLRYCYSRNYPELFEWVAAFSEKQREEIKGFLTYMLRIFRDCLMLNLGNSKNIYLSEPEKEFAQKFSPFVNIRNIEFLNSAVSSAIADIERNGNSKIVMLDTTLQIVRVIKL